ncbi:unnamed protein product [Leuciscus chuanchicus]
MVVRLDIFHWIHRFDAAIHTERNSKYAVFKSALAGAVLAYNRADLELLIKAVRAKDPAYDTVTDEDVVRLYVMREQLKHHVRRVTFGVQETLRLVQTAIDELKGPAGLDESGIPLFKSAEAIDSVWEGQQRHLECIQDPPEMTMYRVARSTSINGLFGEAVEDNFRTPAAVTSNELLGLEYLFSQSTGESGAFSIGDLSKDGPSPEEEVVQPGQTDLDEEDEAYQSDPETDHDRMAVDPAHITLTTDETTNAHPPAVEDTCSPSPLPGLQKLEKFCALLVDFGLTVNRLSLTTKEKNELIETWQAVEEHDKLPHTFHQLYRTHWGNTLYCRTKRDHLVDAAVIQKVKMAKRYAPAQQDISAQHNRLMYTLVKLLWLGLPTSSKTQSPDKTVIQKAYERIQHCILVEDPVLSKVGIPLPKINIKTVRDFIRRQEKLINLQSTRMPSATIVYEHIPSKAGTKVLKGRSDIATPAPKTPSQVSIYKSPLTSRIPQQKPSVFANIFSPLPEIFGSTTTAQSFPPPSLFSAATTTTKILDTSAITTPEEASSSHGDTSTSTTLAEASSSHDDTSASTTPAEAASSHGDTSCGDTSSVAGSASR